jgi:hypothetical protein
LTKTTKTPYTWGVFVWILFEGTFPRHKQEKTPLTTKYMGVYSFQKLEIYIFSKQKTAVFL